MEIHYTISEEDYIQFNLYHMEESPSMRKQFQMLRLYLPILMAVVILLGRCWCFIYNRLVCILSAHT